MSCKPLHINHDRAPKDPTGVVDPRITLVSLTETTAGFGSKGCSADATVVVALGFQRESQRSCDQAVVAVVCICLPISAPLTLETLAEGDSWYACPHVSS